MSPKAPSLKDKVKSSFKHVTKSSSVSSKGAAGANDGSFIPPQVSATSPSPTVPNINPWTVASGPSVRKPLRSEPQDMQSTFDRKLLDPARYNDLMDTDDVIRLLTIIIDYMAYLRKGPRHDESWDLEEETTTAECFLNLIDNDVAWPLAKHVVREFRSEITGVMLEDAEKPLKTVYQRMAPRTPQPLPSRDILTLRKQMTRARLETRLGYLEFRLANSNLEDRESVQPTMLERVEALQQNANVMDVDEPESSQLRERW